MPTGIYRVEQTRLGWTYEFSGDGTDGFGDAATDISSANPYTSLFGLIQGGVVLPDPEYQWEPFYGVGVTSRNWNNIIKGRQVLRGSIPTIQVQHDASRDILATAFGVLLRSDAVSGADSGGAPTTTVTNTSLTDAAQVFTTFKPASSAVRPTSIIIVSPATATAVDRANDTFGYIGPGGVATAVNVFMDYSMSQAGWHGRQPPNNARWLVRQLNPAGPSMPANTTSIVREANYLPSWALLSEFTALDAGILARRYVGCKTDRIVISADMTSKLNMAIEFLSQDVRYDTNPSITTAEWQKRLADGASPARMRVGTQTFARGDFPYVFSEALLTYFGTTFARIRSFRLTMNNNLDPRYYITTPGAVPANIDNSQILYEIIEGRRVYDLSVVIDLDDRVTDAAFLQWMFRQGHGGHSDPGATVTSTNFLGFTVDLLFTRELGAAQDTIRFTMPSTVASSTTEPTNTDLGCFFRSAPHNIGTPTEDLQRVEASIHVPSCRVEFVDA